MPSSPQLVYVTTPDRAEAERIARDVVGAHLAAGVNILDGAFSVYHWQGAVHAHGESLLFIHTRAEVLPALIDRIKALHSYECPCIVALPVVAGFPPFLEWIGAETDVSKQGEPR